MSVLKINASELTNADIKSVALVKRGANRIPFRITKKDEDMLDLSKIGASLFQKKDIAPAIVGVIIAKSADAADTCAVLNKAGVDTSKFTKADVDEAITLTKSDCGEVPESQVLVVKMTDDVALVIQSNAAFVKSVASYDWESTSFSEVMAKGTFSPSVGMAQEMLQRTFYNIMEKADTKVELSKMMSTAVDEFKAYAVSLAKGLPDSVFKADAALSKAAKAKGKAMDDAEDKADGGADDASETASGKKKVKKAAEEISANPTVAVAGRPKGHGGKGTVGESAASNNIEDDPAALAGGAPTHVGDKVSVGSAPSSNIEENSVTRNPGVQKSAEDAKVGKKGLPEDKDRTLTAETSESGAGAAEGAVLKSVTDALSAMAKQITTAVATIKEDVTKVSGRVDALAKQVTKTEEAVSGTVLGSDSGDHESVRKGDDDYEGNVIPLMDTGLMRTVDVIKSVEKFQKRRRA